MKAYPRHIAPLAHSTLGRSFQSLGHSPLSASGSTQNGSLSTARDFSNIFPDIDEQAKQPANQIFVFENTAQR